MLLEEGFQGFYFNLREMFTVSLCEFTFQLEETNLMTDLGINLNLVACWLKLCANEMALQNCDMVLKCDIFNVTARFRRALSFLGLGKV